VQQALLPLLQHPAELIYRKSFVFKNFSQNFSQNYYIWKPCLIFLILCYLYHSCTIYYNIYALFPTVEWFTPPRVPPPPLPLQNFATNYQIL